MLARGPFSAVLHCAPDRLDKVLLWWHSIIYNRMLECCHCQFHLVCLTAIVSSWTQILSLCSWRKSLKSISHRVAGYSWVLVVGLRKRKLLIKEPNALCKLKKIYVKKKISLKKLTWTKWHLRVLFVPIACVQRHARVSKLSSFSPLTENICQAKSVLALYTEIFSDNND